MWMIHLYIYWKYLYFTTKKKLQGDVLEQDIELCPFCCFPVTIHIAGYDEANFLWKFQRFHTFYVCCFSFVLIYKS